MNRNRRYIPIHAVRPRIIDRALYTCLLVAAFAWGCESQDPAERAPEDPPQVDGELLEALGYVQWSDDLDEREKALSGVVRHDSRRKPVGVTCTFVSDTRL